MGPALPRHKRFKKPAGSPGTLLQYAHQLLQTSDYNEAASLAERALKLTGPGGSFELLALSLLGTINVELGDSAAATAYLRRAVALDEDGTRDERIGGGADKFLWLAQLSEEGGLDSVAWYERGVTALQSRIYALQHGDDQSEDVVEALDEAQHKLASALCATAELYLTDLSMEPDAEQRCEALLTQAKLAVPTAETLQTFASLRISQGRPDEARSALACSLAAWTELEPNHRNVPDFAARVGLVRLLLEVDMRPDALKVVLRLVKEDDTSVEAWYLGGLCLFLDGKQQRVDGDVAWCESWKESRTCLSRCLLLFGQQDYEDDQLGEHASEMMSELNDALGMDLVEGDDGDDDDDDDEEWADEQEDDGLDGNDEIKDQT